MNQGLLSNLPAQYAKFITSLVTALVIYINVYGTTWNLKAALLFMAGSLGIAGVPNASKPVAASPPPAQPLQASPNPSQLPPGWPGGRAPGTQ